MMLAPRSLAALASKTLPRPVVTQLKAAYTRYHKAVVSRQNRRWLAQLIADHSARVQTGPFEGMRYGDLGLGFESVAKWLGAYENELHAIVESLCQRPYARVLNVGCAEGYYAVGLARRLPCATVYAFDIDPQAADQCRRLADANGVADRIKVGGRCTVEEVDQLVVGETLVVCDCEGAELELLDPARAPKLTAADVLVELHDFVDPNISGTLSSRFQATHVVNRIRSQRRDPAAYAALAAMKPTDRVLALDEFRPGPMDWFALVHHRPDN